MRIKYALVAFVLIPLATLSGCAGFQQQSLDSDLAVLKTQLAQQQSRFAEQQVLLDALMTGQQKQGADTSQQLGDLRNEVAELARIARKQRESDSGATNNTCPVVDPEANGQPCTNLTFIGQLEVVHLKPPERSLVARVDTGANTSSLDARDIEMFERDGEDYVRFRLPPEILAEDQKQEYERPVSRFVRIIQAGKEDERRAVVELKFRLGGVERMAEFTLTDRKHLTYRALLGRNILRDFFVVDVAHEFLVSNRDDSNEPSGDGDDEDDGDEEATDDEEAGENNGAEP